MTVDLDELLRLRAAADAADQSLWSTRVVARGAFYDAAHTALPELVRELRDLRTWHAGCKQFHKNAESVRKENAKLSGLVDHQIAERDVLRAEVERLRKLFDDAGQGEHNVLALIDHYQSAAFRADEEIERLKAELANANARVAEYEVSCTPTGQLRDLRESACAVIDYWYRDEYEVDNDEMSKRVDALIDAVGDRDVLAKTQGGA